jgi:N-carbamoylputrescine amidase
MALMGAELLMYPTAIGSEPYDADLDTSRMWRRAMMGHAVSNCMPVIAANRIGTEGPGSGSTAIQLHLRRMGRSGPAEYGAGETGVLVATLDLAARPPTAPAWASSATAARSFTGGSRRTSEPAHP